MNVYVVLSEEKQRYRFGDITGSTILGVFASHEDAVQLVESITDISITHALSVPVSKRTRLGDDHVILNGKSECYGVSVQLDIYIVAEEIRE